MWVVPHLLLLLTTPRDPVGHRALDIDLIAVHEVSLLPRASDQALWAQQQAIIPFISMLLKTARCGAMSPNPPKTRETVLKKMTMPMKTRVGLRPQVMGRWHQMVEEWQECPHTQDTLTDISQVFGEHKDTDPQSDPGEKIQSIQ